MDSRFSYDINLEILSRTSLKTLDTMRCTSKEFKKITYDPYFLNMYKQRNNIISGFLVVKQQNGSEYTNDFAPAPESNSLDLSFLPRDAKIVASSEQGIMVFESPPQGFDAVVCYHVCKPATKQVLALPTLNSRYHVTQRVAMVVVGSKPLHYKIIRLSLPKLMYNNLCARSEINRYRCEIFDSGTWAWRLQEGLPDSFFLSYYKHLITARGSIYMLLTNNEVMKFDAYSDEWTTFPSPIFGIEDYQLHTPKKLVKYQGKLGFACMSRSQLSWEIWVLTSDESWEKLHGFMEKGSLEAIYDSDTIVMWDDMKLVFYRFKEGDSISKAPKIIKGPYPEIFAFRSDFVLEDLEVDKC